MKRYQVIRQWFKYGKKLYHKGELLPVEFTERDQYRNTYPSRVVLIEVPDDELSIVEASLEKEVVPGDIIPMVSIPIKIVTPAVIISVPVRIVESGVVISVPINNIPKISVPVEVSKTSTGISAISSTKGITPAAAIGARVNNAITGTTSLSNSAPKK